MAMQRDYREMQQPRPELDEGVDVGSRKEVPNVGRLRGLDQAVQPLEGEDVDGGGGEEDVDDGGSDDFEFAVLPRRSFDGVESVTADEIFSNGLIRPVYPLFGSPLVSRDGGAATPAATGEAEDPLKLPLRELMIRDRVTPSTSSTESDELDGLPAASYCVWAPRSLPPSPDLRRKSHSTGTTSKRWRFFNLVVGRSHSDGKEKLVFLEPPHPSGAAAATQKTSHKPASGDRSKKTAAVGDVPRGRGNGRGGGRVSEMDVVTAHRLFYSRGGVAPGDRRRSLLPYRKDLVRLFGNASNAAGSSFQPC